MTQNRNKITYITAECKLKCCNNRVKTWSRSTIGNIIENIPAILKREEKWKNVLIEYENGGKQMLYEN